MVYSEVVHAAKGSHMTDDTESIRAVRGVRLTHLSAWRRFNVLTQAELATKAGVARATVNRAEGGGPISMENTRQIAAALGITPQQLLAGPPEGYAEVDGAA